MVVSMYCFVCFPATKVVVEELDSHAEIMAMNAIILQELSRPSIISYKFDWDKVTFAGKLVLQYTHARLCR